MSPFFSNPSPKTPRWRLGIVLVTLMVCLNLNGCVYQDWKRAETVRKIYNETLQTEPTIESLDYWVKTMEQGATEDDIRHLLRNSKEYYQAMVKRAYYKILRRPPDPDGWQGWTQYVQTHQSTDAELETIFLNTEEYRVNFGPTPQLEAEIVESLYNEVLHQQPTLHELKTAAVQLQMGSLTEGQLREQLKKRLEAVQPTQADLEKIRHQASKN